MTEFPYLETRYDKEEKQMYVWIDYIDMHIFIDTVGVESECFNYFELYMNYDCLCINMWKYENGNYREWLKDLSKLSKAFKKMYEEDE